VATKQFVCVGDIASAATEVATQRGHKKRYIQDMQLVRQDLLRKASLEVHDGVKREGPTNHSSHVVVRLGN
jgi:hypothetical protein